MVLNIYKITDDDDNVCVIIPLKIDIPPGVVDQYESYLNKYTQYDILYA